MEGSCRLESSREQVGGFGRRDVMRFFLLVAVVVAALVWGAYRALLGVGLIDEGCPSVGLARPQVVIENKLPLDLRVVLHDAAQQELRVVARTCIAADVSRLKVAVETWAWGLAGLPNCLVELVPSQKATVYERGGLTYCDVGRADIDLDG